MTTTWTDLLPGVDGEPVRGLPWQYGSAESTSRRIAVATGDAAAEFASVKASSDLGELRGATADQLVGVVEHIDGSFAELPGVFGALEALFDQHQQRLTELRAAARTALAVARTRRQALDDARDHESERTAALQRVQNQVWYLRRTASSEAELTELEIAEQRRRDRSWQLTVATSARESAEAELAESRAEWQRLRDDEGALVSATAVAVKHLDLGDLKDPNAVMGFLGGVASWGLDLAGDVWNAATAFVEAAMEGRWLDALHHLSDLIGAVLEIAAVVALGVAIFATGGALAGALPLILLGVGGLKLVTDAVLASTQHPHPVTGQPKSWTDVAIDAAILAVSAATLGVGDKLGRAASGMQGEFRRSAAGNVRQIIRPVSGAGNPLYGAARTSTIVRSQRELTTVLVAEGFDYGRDTALDAAGDRVRMRAAPGPAITTEAEAWRHPSIVEHARSSPVTAVGLDRIERHITTIRSGAFVAPTTSGAGSHFHLVGSPS